MMWRCGHSRGSELGVTLPWRGRVGERVSTCAPGWGESQNVRVRLDHPTPLAASRGAHGVFATLPLQGRVAPSSRRHHPATRSNLPCPVVSRFSIVTAVALPAAPTWNVTALGPYAFSPTGW
jgi:hypothetical protein